MNQSEEAQHRGLIEQQRVGPLCPKGQRPRPLQPRPQAAQVKWNQAAQVFEQLHRRRRPPVQLLVATVTGSLPHRLTSGRVPTSDPCGRERWEESRGSRGQRSGSPVRQLLLGPVLVEPDEEPLSGLAVRLRHRAAVQNPHSREPVGVGGGTGTGQTGPTGLTGAPGLTGPAAGCVSARGRRAAAGGSPELSPPPAWGRS